MYAKTAYHLHPFLEDFEFLTYPFLGAIGRLPSWFLMAYFFVAYLVIVRRKEWPHFFRFHVVMGMLLDIALEVIGTISHWMPLAVYWGKVGMLLWTALTFAYLKEWPHFFRFHVVMGMLFDIALEVIGTISCWMPLAVYWGKVGMLFWTALAFAYLFTVLESIRCALAGMYADIPFVCDELIFKYPMINESQHIGCNRWNYVSYSVLVEH